MSRRRKTGELSAEDRILWSRIARSVDPLHGKRWPPDVESTKPDEAHKHGAAALTRTIHHPPYEPVQQRPGKRPAGRAIDPPTRKKLVKGRLPIDATIDLHGLDQADAHGMLLAFLHRASASGLRHVLAITGKGTSFGSSGVLRRLVPEWLGTEPFAGLVSGFDWAGRQHGGDGAIYIRLKRRGKAP